MNRIVIAALGAAVLVVSSCQRDDSTPSPVPAAAAISKVAGDAQAAAPEATVAVSPAVLVTDQLGNPLAGVAVEFAVTTGGGSVWQGSARTDAAGRASCEGWRVGAARGLHALSASVSGIAPAVFTATVAADVLLDLGHAQQVTVLRTDGSRVLSGDASGHWALWDRASCTPVASGDTPGDPGVTAFADLAGPTVLVEFPTGFEVRASSDGRLLSRVHGTHAWRRLAPDGSYVYAGSSTALSAWSPDGQLRFSRDGGYSNARTVADSAAIRVAGGPAGTNVIETIDASTGSSSVGPTFSGQFHSWFSDGQRFLANLSTNVWIYSRAGAQEALFSLPTIENLAGQGRWIWTFGEHTRGNPLALYAIDGGGTPAVIYPLEAFTRVIPSGTTLGIVFYDPRVSIIDLSGDVPARTDFTLPVAYPSTYAGTSAGAWFVGNRHGVVLDGASLAGPVRTCGLGEAWSVAGGGGRVAVATAAGKVLYYDAASSTLEGQLAFASSNLQLSADGAVLGAAANANDYQYAPDRTLKVFSLPAGTELRSWPYGLGTLTGFTLSGSGAQVGHVRNTAVDTCDREVLPVAGGAATWTGGASPCPGSPILLSPSGNRVAFSSGLLWPRPWPETATATTSIYQDGALVTAVPGRGAGWLDESRLLVNTYQLSGGLLPTPVFAGAVVHDPTGAVVATLSLPEIASFQPVSTGTVYDPGRNAIYAIDTGAAIWAGPSGFALQHGNGGLGAVAGGRVVYPLGSRVLSEPY